MVINITISLLNHGITPMKIQSIREISYFKTQQLFYNVKTNFENFKPTQQFSDNWIHVLVHLLFKDEFYLQKFHSSVTDCAEKIY